jgi:hypothetical protein
MFVSNLDLLGAQHQLFNPELPLSESKRDINGDNLMKDAL